MKITVERDALHEALSGVLSRTKTGATIPILSHVLIVAKDQTATLTGHDLDSCSVVTLRAEVGIAGSVTIPADRLAKLTAGLPRGSQVMIEVDGLRAVVRCGRALYRFGTMPANDFPGALTSRDAVSFVLTNEQVLRAFKVPAPSISEEKTRVYLHGITLHQTKEGIAAVATDGHTLIRTLLAVEAPEFAQIIVPKSAVAEIVSVAGKGEVTIEICPTLVAVSAGNRRFVTKLIDGTFPDYGRVIPQPVKGPIKVDPDALDAALARLVAACDPDQSPVVKLKWSDNGVLHALLHSQFADGAEVVEADLGDTNPGEVGIQIEYLRKLIDAAGGEIVHLHISGPSDPVRVESPSAPDFVAVVMPCRV